ncbi:MAG: hypothetical protein DMD25_00660 [Gemmatimonadetes bacterium]|nr:MAG: hypothetical protein DMD25_00660 [Gemmatimonadota bacterium]
MRPTISPRSTRWPTRRACCRTAACTPASRRTPQATWTVSPTWGPPHQGMPANAYTDGLTALGTIYRRCEERGLPVMIHTGTSIFPGARSKYGNPMELDDVAIDFPDLRIVMAHGGRPLYMEEAFFVLRRHRGMWLDVSGIPPARLLEYFPRLSELADRVLWGTDWPSPGVKDMRINIDQFLALPLSDAHKKAILETNALALFPAPR